MSQAGTKISTPRRSLFGFGAGGIVANLFRWPPSEREPSEQNPPPKPTKQNGSQVDDGDLIARCKEFQREFAAYWTLLERDDEVPDAERTGFEASLKHTRARQMEARAGCIDAVAQTIDGCRAKAEVLLNYQAAIGAVDLDFDGLLGLSIARDLVKATT